jgi:hypothetical protein
MDVPGRWRRSETALWRVVLDDAVILGPGHDEPVALAGGAALWALLAEPLTIDELTARLGAADPAADPAAGLAALLTELSQSGAVEWLPA